MPGKPDDIPQDVWDAAVDAERVRTSRELGWRKADVPVDSEYVEPIARAILAERERFRPILTQLYGEVVWNAYNTGIVRADGKWIDGGMSDAEWLRVELGFAAVPQYADALRAALPGLIDRKVDAAIRTTGPSNPAHGYVTDLIARAMLAERERCAKLAEREGVYPELNVAGGGPEWYRHAQRIASAIRKGGA